MELGVLIQRNAVGSVTGTEDVTTMSTVVPASEEIEGETAPCGIACGGGFVRLNGTIRGQSRGQHVDKYECGLMQMGSKLNPIRVVVSVHIPSNALSPVDR